VPPAADCYPTNLFAPQHQGCPHCTSGLRNAIKDPPWAGGSEAGSQWMHPTNQPARPPRRAAPLTCAAGRPRASTELVATELGAAASACRWSGLTGPGRSDATLVSAAAARPCAGAAAAGSAAPPPPRGPAGRGAARRPRVRRLLRRTASRAPSRRARRPPATAAPSGRCSAYRPCASQPFGGFASEGLRRAAVGSLFARETTCARVETNRARPGALLKKEIATGRARPRFLPEKAFREVARRRPGATDRSRARSRFVGCDAGAPGSRFPFLGARPVAVAVAVAKRRRNHSRLRGRDRTGATEASQQITTFPSCHRVDPRWLSPSYVYLATSS